MADSSDDQGVRDDEVAVTASGAVPDPAPQASGITALVRRVIALRPVRVLLHYSNDNGPLIAAGMTYQAVFALFAGLWFAFSVAGFVIAHDRALQSAVFGAINGFVPGLIDDGRGEGGALSARVLLDATALSWSGAVSLVGVLLTAVGFLGTLRTAVRIMFALPGPAVNPVVLKLKDLGLTFAFGAVVLLTAAISVVSNTVLDGVSRTLGLGTASAAQHVLATLVSALVLAAIDAAILAGAFRILSGIPIPVRRLLVGALLGGAGLALLQTLGTSLLGGARSNPVVGTFATLVGVLLYFDFVCQVILIAASWVAVGMADAGIDARSLSPEQRQQERAEQLEHARRLVAQANREALEERLRGSRGLQRWRLARELEREVRAEARRRAEVPTASEFAAAQAATGDPSPDAQQVEEAVQEGASPHRGR